MFCVLQILRDLLRKVNIITRVKLKAPLVTIKTG